MNNRLFFAIIGITRVREREIYVRLSGRPPTVTLWISSRFSLTAGIFTHSSLMLPISVVLGTSLSPRITKDFHTRKEKYRQQTEKLSLALKKFVKLEKGEKEATITTFITHSHIVFFLLLLLMDFGMELAEWSFQWHFESRTIEQLFED